MYASVIKAITKMTKNENEKKNIVKKTTTKIMTTEKEKKLIIRVKNEFEKKLKITAKVEFFKRIKKITNYLKNETINLK